LGIENIKITSNINICEKPNQFIKNYLRKINYKKHIYDNYPYSFMQAYTYI